MHEINDKKALRDGDVVKLVDLDLLGNITSITDAEGRITYFDYNDLGRLIKVRDPLYGIHKSAKSGCAVYWYFSELLQA